MLLSQFPLTFPSNSKGDALFHLIAYDYSRAIGIIFVIISEIFHWRISLNSVLLLLLVNFVSGLRLELIYISLIVNTRSYLTHLYDFQLLLLLPSLIEIIFLVCTNRINLLHFRQASNHCKRALEAAKLPYANKTKESITSQKPGSRNFWEIVNSVANSVNKSKSAIPPLFNGPEVLSFASEIAKLFAKIFSRKSYLDDSGISLPVPSSRTNLKLRNISIFPILVKKVITNLDLSKTFDPD